MKRTIFLPLLFVLCACVTPVSENERLVRLSDVHCIGNKNCWRESLSPNRAVRDGDRLTLILASGKTVKLEGNRKACAEDEVAKCIVYTLLADLPRRHFFLVSEGFYEGGDNFLIDDHTGARTDIGRGLPTFSPDDLRFVVVEPWDVYGGDTGGVKIWRRDGDKTVPDWSYTNIRGDAAYADLTDIFYVQRLVRWETEGRIVFDFIAEKNDQGQGDEKRWQGTLTRQGDGWKLAAQAPER